MRDKAFTMRLCGSAAAAVVLVLGAGCLVQAGSDTAAHDIAEKFAKEAAKGDAKTRPRAETGQPKANSQVRKAGEDPLQAEEAEMLARARAEAEQRRVDMMRARTEAERSDRQRKADEELGQAEARRKAQEDARLAEEADRKAEEERRLVAARKAEEDARAAEALRQAEVLRQAEEDARIAAEAKQAEAARMAEEERVQAEAQRRAEEARLAEVRRAEELERAEETRRTAEDDERRTALQSEREAEAQRLADRLRSVREEREARAVGDSATARRDVSAGPATHQMNSSKAPVDIDIAMQRERRVAVLLLMQPGDRGIRRNNKSADPVLCSYHDCYVSNGPDSAASLLPARKALGFFRTWGTRAGACNNSLGCVFRGVELDNMDGMLMPVDMRVVRHDRREPREVETVSDCRLERDRLACRNGIYADDYAMWLVPESLAGKVGPAALLQALHDGLPASERTASAPSR
jgi:hypothetical protein